MYNLVWIFPPNLFNFVYWFQHLHSRFIYIQPRYKFKLLRSVNYNFKEKKKNANKSTHNFMFSPGTPASSTTKTDRHDIAEILLNVAL